MGARPLELEGTWEEILAHAGELAGCRVRLTVLPSSAQPTAGRPTLVQEPDPVRVARVRGLRGKLAGTADARASELLHQERQTDKAGEEQAIHQSRSRRV